MCWGQLLLKTLWILAPDTLFSALQGEAKSEHKQESAEKTLS